MTQATLSHVGVKGMKWGVRKSDIPASSDHVQAQTAKQKAKAGGGLKVLSNKEIQDVVTRMNLEQQFGRLNPSVLKKGQQLVTELLGIGNTVNTAINAGNTLITKIKSAK